MIRSLIILVALTFVVPVARAQDGSSAAKLSLARSLFAEAVSAVKKNDWETAHTKFKKSYELAPRVTTLLNLGGAQFETGRYLEASESFKRFLREATDKKYETQREGVRSQLATIERRLARAKVKIRNLAKGDVVSIDGTEFPASVLDQALPFNPGVHTVVVDDSRGKELVRRQFSLKGGVTTTVNVLITKRKRKADTPVTKTNPRQEKPPTPTVKRDAKASKTLVVIVNTKAGVKSVTRGEVRNIFLGKSIYWKNGKAVRAFRRSLTSKPGKFFLSKVMRMRFDAYKLHWDERQLSGGGLPPRKVSSAKKLIDAVKANPGGIGFLLESELPTNTSGLRIFRL